MRRPIIVIAVLAAVSLLLWLIWPSKPPDIAGCTRLEIRYENGAMYEFSTSHWLRESVLNQQEIDHVRSLDKWILTDPNRITAFARIIREGSYAGVRPGPVAGYGVYVTGYRGDIPTTGFVMYSNTVIAHKCKAFTYARDLRVLPAIEPPGIKPLTERGSCALRLYEFRFTRWVRAERAHLPPPDPNRWCDIYAEHFRFRGDTAVVNMMTCPSVHPSTLVHALPVRHPDANAPCQDPRGWTCDYAMNPYCDPNSPKDVVFVFESKPGWNQHGGPELFNFDNHDPKGGCVVLNDGTVRFIRTKEELAQLHWKP